MTPIFCDAPFLSEAFLPVNRVWERITTFYYLALPCTGAGASTVCSDVLMFVSKKFDRAAAVPGSSLSSQGSFSLSSASDLSGAAFGG